MLQSGPEALGLLPGSGRSGAGFPSLPLSLQHTPQPHSSPNLHLYKMPRDGPWACGAQQPPQTVSSASPPSVQLHLHFASLAWKPFSPLLPISCRQMPVAVSTGQGPFLCQLHHEHVSCGRTVWGGHQQGEHLPAPQTAASSELGGLREGDTSPHSTATARSHHGQYLAAFLWEGCQCL